VPTLSPYPAAYRAAPFIAQVSLLELASSATKQKTTTQLKTEKTSEDTKEFTKTQNKTTDHKPTGQHTN